MKRFYLFRTDLRILEDYHKYKSLEEFKHNCWDFYLIQGLYFLENNYFDEVVIWRLHPNKKIKQEVIFDINGKKFIQRWVDDFEEVYKYPKSLISFFRGGFCCFDYVVKKDKNHLGKTLYLGAGQRVFPQYGGKYDKILVEDKSDFNSNFNCSSFYKTANPEIFHPVNKKIKYDICWPCNWTQEKYKGQKFFIKKVAGSSFLRSLKIIHVGNNPDCGKKMCEKYKVTNIEFADYTNRFGVNKLLNTSKFGLVTSNKTDGCPRISTEILMSGTPMILREQTRLLDYYKRKGVIIFNDDNIEGVIRHATIHYNFYKQEILGAVKNELSFDTICELNIKEWKK